MDLQWLLFIWMTSLLLENRSLNVKLPTMFYVNSFCLLVSILALPRTEEGGAVSQIYWCSVRHHLS